MYIRKIKFMDFNGVEREGEFFFHMNKGELLKWMMQSGDYTIDKVLERIAKERNGKRIIETFEDLIERSYGEVSLDGAAFVKDPEKFKIFKATEAYSELFVSLVTDAEEAAKFVSGIIPADMNAEIQKVMAENPDGIPDEYKDLLGNVVPTTPGPQLVK